MPKMNGFRCSRVSLAAAATALMLAAASGAIFEVEPFDYPSNPTSGLNALAGGTGWAGAWSDTDPLPTLASTNTSLAYPPNVPLTPTGGRLETTADSVDNPAFRLLGTTMNLALGSQTFYSSALFRRSAETGELSSVLFDRQSDELIRWYYGIDENGFFTTGLNPLLPAQRATSTFAAAADTTYFLVSKIRTNTGPFGNDEVFLRVFAQGSPVTEPTSDPEWDLTANGNSGVILDRLRLSFSNVAGQANQFDELRVGTSFADVTGIPEPGSGLLLAFGATALIARNRRR